eukprot:290087-Hanusia_phi.AAC.1
MDEAKAERQKLQVEVRKMREEEKIIKLKLHQTSDCLKGAERSRRMAPPIPLQLCLEKAWCLWTLCSSFSPSLSPPPSPGDLEGMLSLINYLMSDLDSWKQNLEEEEEEEEEHKVSGKKQAEQDGDETEELNEEEEGSEMADDEKDEQEEMLEGEDGSEQEEEDEEDEEDDLEYQEKMALKDQARDLETKLKDSEAKVESLKQEKEELEEEKKTMADKISKLESQVKEVSFLRETELNFLHSVRVEVALLPTACPSLHSPSPLPSVSPFCPVDKQTQRAEEAERLLGIVERKYERSMGSLKRSREEDEDEDEDEDEEEYHSEEEDEEAGEGVQKHGEEEEEDGGDEDGGEEEEVKEEKATAPKGKKEVEKLQGKQRNPSMKEARQGEGRLRARRRRRRFWRRNNSVRQAREKFSTEQASRREGDASTPIITVSSLHSTFLIPSLLAASTLLPSPLVPPPLPSPSSLLLSPPPLARAEEEHENLCRRRAQGRGHETSREQVRRLRPAARAHGSASEEIPARASIKKEESKSKSKSRTAPTAPAPAPAPVQESPPKQRSASARSVSSSLPPLLSFCPDRLHRSKSAQEEGVGSPAHIPALRKANERKSSKRWSSTQGRYVPSPPCQPSLLPLLLLPIQPPLPLYISSLSSAAPPSS